MFWTRRKVVEAPVPLRETPRPDPPRPDPETVEIEEKIYRIYLDWDTPPEWQIVASGYTWDTFSEQAMFYVINKYRWERAQHPGSDAIHWYKHSGPHELLLSIRSSDIKAIEVIGAQTREIPCE
jgi:hypothetical protein